MTHEEPLSRERLGVYLRLGLAVAILSAACEAFIDVKANFGRRNYELDAGAYLLAAAGVGIFASVALVALEKYSRAGVGLFLACLLIFVPSEWPDYANHSWLAVWTIPVAVAFGAEWWKSDLYKWYLRATLGVVMLGASAQKLLAGSYLDGSYITFLSLYGSTTEQMFGFLCGPEAAEGSCAWHRVIGTFIVIWQAAVGILLLAGLRNLLFLFVEIAFLLGAGVYADEMNFQVLNIALLSIGFGYGMRPWLLAVCAAMLVVDGFGIGVLLGYVL